jgi:hypothetical protein
MNVPRQRRTGVHAMAAVALVLGAGCGPGSPPSVDGDGNGDDQGSIAVATCDRPIGALPLPASEPEASGTLDDALAALPERIEAAGAPRWETAELAPFLREVVAWMLEVPLGTLGTLDGAALAGGGPLEQAVALAFLNGDGRRPDVATLRRGLHRSYACVRRLPLALPDALALAGGLDPATEVVVPTSTPKGHARRLHTSRDGALFAAETIIDGEVRETEIVWRGRRRDDALDFLVYDAAGQLRDGSTFVTSNGPETAAAAPYACLACHRDRAGGAGFVVAFPTAP